MAPEEASAAEAVGPGAGNLGRGKLFSVACPEEIMAPAFPMGSGMAPGGGQPGDNLLLQGTASPTGTLGSCDGNQGNFHLSVLSFPCHPQSTK